MELHEIKLRNFRSYDLFSANLSNQVTIILGKNGTGKTSLLEAINYILQGSSFRGRTRDMLAHNTSRADIVAVYGRDVSRRASIAQNDDGTVKRSFTINGRQVQRLTAATRLPVILFEPEELRLINSSPERRRKFLDTTLSRLYPQYSTLASRYQRALMQRNNLLKQRDANDSSVWGDQLFIWDIKLAELAEKIIKIRHKYILRSNSQLSPHYSALSSATHSITTTYQSVTAQESYKQTLLNQLHANRTADSYRGYTSVGPHRDDLIIHLDGYPAAETASRGEMRTIMLAYKLMEIELQTEAYGDSPLILMDDVFSELDKQREAKLMNRLRNHQTIITATDLREELQFEASIVRL